MGNTPSYKDLATRLTILEKENARLQNLLSQQMDHPRTGDKPLRNKETEPIHLALLASNALDQFPYAIFWKDTNSRYLGCNTIFAENVGLQETSDIIGLSDYDLPWKKSEIPSYLAKDREIMANKTAEFNIVKQLQTASGKIIWVDSSKFPIHNSAGEVIGILGTYEDISSKVEAEQTLKNYQTITATIDDLMAIVDRNYIYQAVNEAYEKAYGKTIEEIVGTTISNLIGNELSENQVTEKIEQAFTGETVTYETWRDFPKWGNRYVHCSYYPIFDEDKQMVIGVVTKIRDMTPNKKLETQLQQSQKMEAIGRLAGGIAHDFNNILSVINGYSDLCRMKMENDHPCLPHIDMIKESGQRATRLTQQLLAFSRRQIIKPELINLSTELSTIYQMLDRLLGENVQVDMKEEKPLWDVKLDRGQLEQIVMNLAVNARDAMIDGGKLTIETANITFEENSSKVQFSVAPGDYVMLAISDNGIGMTPEIQQNIFEPFFTTKDIQKGTGLGLSTVYGIIKQNHGHITVYSEPGKGTTFKLYFPRSLERDYSNAIESQLDSNIEMGDETILLVEDDYALRQLCVELLTDLGYTILEASNGREAIETSQKFDGKIDLLLTDVVMPELNGPDTARLLAKKHPDLRVIFMSGYTENAIVHHGVLDEGINFVHKPISHPILAKTIRKVLENADSTDSDK